MQRSSRDGKTRPPDMPAEKLLRPGGAEARTCPRAVLAGMQMDIPRAGSGLCSSRPQQLELDMEQQTGSKEGNKYVKAVYCHRDYLTYMQGTS